MSCSNFTTILTYFNDALLERLVNSALIAGESMNDYIELERQLSFLCPGSPDNPSQPSEANQNKLERVVSDTQTIQREVGKILAEAVKLEPVYDEGVDLAAPAEQKLYYLGEFIDSLTRLINGKQNLDITKNQMVSRSDLPEAFSDFLDKTLPAIADAADSRRNNIKELNEDFVSNFKEVVKDYLGYNALIQLERLDSLIVKNLARVHESIKQSEQYVDFNLDLYAPELTQNKRGEFGLNIFISVGNHQGQKATNLLDDMALNISKEGFDVRLFVVEGKEDDQVYRIAIPLGEA
ncbi:MAG: hypothetical protein VKK32_06540 [Candidatus Melainabacteria bacterium]|nr:hypothetical protein [Candidatus Melainabacteria bacterium]